MSTAKVMRAEKVQMFEEISELFEGATFIYFVSYKGLKAKELAAFRGKIVATGAKCHVLKNRVLAKVAEAKGFTAIAQTKISGDTAVIFGTDDPGQTAKVIEEFAKDTKNVLAGKGGYIEGGMLSADEVKAMANLPTKDQLRAQLLGLLVAVPTGLVRVLNAKAASILNVLNAYKNKLEEKPN